MELLYNVGIGFFLFINSVVTGTLGLLYYSDPSIVSPSQSAASSTRAISLTDQSTETTTVEATLRAQQLTQSNQLFSWIPFYDLPDLYMQSHGQIFLAGTHDSFPNADPATFQVAVNESGLPIAYARDKSHVYWFDVAWDDASEPERVSAANPEIVIGADPDSFVPIFGIPVTDLTAQQINNIIGPTHNWQCLYDAYGKDDKNAYFQNYIISGADPNTFSIVFDSNGCPTNFDKDADDIFWDDGGEQSSIILRKDIDIASFRVLNEFYVEDKNRVYNSTGYPISDDPQHFIILNPPMSCGWDCLYDAEDGTNKFFAGNNISDFIR